MDIEALNYKQTAEDFINQFMSGLNVGITCVEKYYHKDTLCSMHIYKNGHIDVTETQGYCMFKNKLYVLLINSFVYKNCQYISQPLAPSIGNNKILLSVSGIATINNIDYSFSSTFIFKKDNYNYLIENYMLHIYM
jgi:hypothetical protein